jgi:tripartite-type tricarboxylate transporter receptor subunit TctC
MTMVKRFTHAVAALTLALGPFAAYAQAYPTKPIRLVVPFGAGSTADIIARQIGASMSKELGQQAVVENKPGAGGTIGAADVARAAPDGYTLVLGTVASHGTGALMMANVSFDPVKDFQAITLIANAPSIMVVHNSVAVRTPAELVDYLRKNPGTNFTSSGPGTTAHLAGESFAMKTGTKLVHVPYKAVGQAIADTVAGQVKMMVYQVPSLKPHIDSGTLRAIAVVGEKRVAALPNVPTVAETLIPGFEFTPWFGMMAPAGTPRPIVQRLHGAILKSMETPEMKKQLDAQGLEAVGMGPDPFSDFIKTDIQRWREVITASGVKAQ